MFASKSAVGITTITKQVSANMVLGRLAVVPDLAALIPPGGLRDRLKLYMATSPGRLVRMFITLAILAIAVGLVQVFVISHIRSAITVIGISTRPSIVAAEQASAALATMDAEATNDALLGGLSASGTGTTFQTATAEISRLLIAASRNITYEKEEVSAIDDLQKNLFLYYGTLGEARYMVATNPWAALQRLKWASRINQGFITPAANALGNANSQPMEAAYTSYNKSYLGFGILGIGAGFLLIAALVKFQIVIARQTNRILNGPMALATVIAVLSQILFMYAIIAEHSAIRTAKLDAFDSVASLYRTKVAALRANADESMWLLDKDTRVDTEKSFQTLAASVFPTGKLAGPKLKSFLMSMDSAIVLEGNGKAKEALASMPPMGGFLGKAADNMTFGIAERKPLTDATVAFIRYIKIDGLIRRLETSGYHTEALALNVGVKPGAVDWSVGWDDVSFDKALQSHDMVSINRILHITGDSDWAFSLFETALDKTILVNETVFDEQINKAMRLVTIMTPLELASILGVTLLAAVGLWRRYQEYA